MLKDVRFRVQNFRNIDDSGWIPLERVTAFVGRNESGKSALLKALHKFNPATPEPYHAQREFPRDRFTREFNNPANWPVCSVAFQIGDDLRKEVEAILGRAAAPKEAICTRYYDGALKTTFEPNVANKAVEPAPVIEALKVFASSARRLPAPAPEQEEQTQTLRTDLATWGSGWVEQLNPHTDVRNEKGITLLSTLRKESEARANPQTAAMVEALQAALDSVLAEARKPPAADQIVELVKPRLPIFIYFENYGILDSAIYLPRFLEDLKRTPDDPKIRTINAMFKHVRLTAQEVSDLGREQAQQAIAQKQQPTPEMIAKDQENKEARAIKLNSASIDISKRFSDWWKQRRHKIRYHADGDYFRIWVADDKRPDVEIELEARARVFSGSFRSTSSSLSNQTRGIRMPFSFLMSRDSICIRPHSRNLSRFSRSSAKAINSSTRRIHPSLSTANISTASALSPRMIPATRA